MLAMRSITALVLALPVGCMLLAMDGRYPSFDLLTVWHVVSFACLAWGIYIRKRLRVLSWGCIICALVQFGMLLPFYFKTKYGGPG
jgi:hypothetical protein